MPITLREEPVAYLRTGLTTGSGVPYQWKVEGLDKEVFICLLNGTEPRYHITDETTDRAADQPSYPSLKDALASIESRPVVHRTYVGRTWYPNDVPVEQHRLQVEFEFKPKNAGYYKTWQEAENDCVSIFRKGIEVKLPNGGSRIVEDFNVEELGPKEFVIYCENPFIRRTEASLRLPSASDLSR